MLFKDYFISKFGKKSGSLYADHFNFLNTEITTSSIKAFLKMLWNNRVKAVGGRSKLKLLLMEAESSEFLAAICGEYLDLLSETELEINIGRDASMEDDSGKTIYFRQMITELETIAAS